MVVLGVAAAAAVGMRLWLRAPHHAAPELATGVYLQPHRPLPDFSLIDDHGRTFTRARLDGRWSMLYFGYTHCPDLCPATLATLAAMTAAMRAAHDPVLPRVIFVSVDARRDTPAALARYVPLFDPSFTGLTATRQRTVARFARALGVAVVLGPATNGAYSVEHSDALFVVDPHGALAAILTGPFSAANLRGDLRLIMAAGA